MGLLRAPSYLSIGTMMFKSKSERWGRHLLRSLGPLKPIFRSRWLEAWARLGSARRRRRSRSCYKRFRIKRIGSRIWRKT